MLAASAVDIISHKAHSIAFDKIVQLRTLDPTTQNIPPIMTFNIRQPAVKNSLRVGEPVVTSHLLHVYTTPSSAHAQAALCTVLLETYWMCHLISLWCLTGVHAFP